MFKSIGCSLPIAVLVTVAQAGQQDLNTVLQNARMSNGNVEANQGQTGTMQVQKLGFKKMDVVRTVNSEQVDNPQKAMELYNQMKADDVATVERSAASDARCVPNIVPGTSGHVSGFKCLQVSRDSALDKAGVIDGDVVMSIDGQMLTSPSQLLSKVASRKYSQIVVMRNGQEVVLH